MVSFTERIALTGDELLLDDILFHFNHFLG